MRNALLVGLILVAGAQAGALRSTAKVVTKATTTTVKTSSRVIVKTSKRVFKAVW